MVVYHEAMKQSPDRIIIVGAGFGGVYTYKKLHRLFRRNKYVQLSIVSEKNYFLFTPLLHEVATGGLHRDNIVEPIRKVLGDGLHEFHVGQVKQINLNSKTVQCDSQTVPYDYLVLAPGSQTNFFKTPGAADHTFTLKSVEDAMRLKNHCITLVERAAQITDRATRKNMLRFVVVGGGATGVELIAELQEFLKLTFAHYYSKEVIDDVSLVLVQSAPELLPQFTLKLRQKSLQVLKQKGVEVLLNTKVVEVGPSYVLLGSGERRETATVIWVAGIQPTEVNFDSPIERSPDGRMIVNEHLQLLNHPEAFVLGDAAAVVAGPTSGFLPALAQVAVAEAATVAQNIKSLRENKPLRSIHYRSKGTLISLGRWMAIGEIAGVTISGRFAWWLWRTVYLFKLISWQKKAKVAVDWTVNLFSPRDISEL